MPTLVEKEIVLTIPLKKAKKKPVAKKKVAPKHAYIASIAETFPKKPRTVRGILVKALFFIKRRWIKGQLYGPYGAVCSLGAIYRAVGDEGEGRSSDASNLASSILGRHTGFYNTSVAGFNDHPMTTKAKVVAAFEAAIKDPESKTRV